MDKNKEFIQLHCHSEFSTRDALSKLSDLINYVKENKLTHLSITDHGNISVWARQFKYCNDNKIKPIFGCELYINNYRHLDKDTIKDDEIKNKYKKYYHLIAIAKNDIGLKNLIKINNDAHINGFYYKPRTDFDILTQYKEGLIITSACLGGEIPHYLLNNNYVKAREIALKYKNVFCENFYLELQPNNMEEQIVVNKKIIQLASELNIQLIITNDCHYIKKEDQKAHDILIAIRDRTSKSDSKDDIQGYHAKELYYKMYSEMKESWEAYHKCEIFTEEIFEKSIDNVIKIKNEIGVIDFNDKIKLPTLYKKEKEYEIFCEKIEEGLRWRYNSINDEIRDRIEYEKSILRKMDYIGYFLIMEDIAKWVWNRAQVVTPGRGSSGGSLVAYVLGITNIDPLKHQLLFERFLDLGRDKAIFYKLI